MSLQFQTVSVKMAGGLDTKTDEKAVIAGDLTALENGVFTNADTISKRNGYDALPTAVTSGAGSIGVSDAFGVYKPSPAVEERLQFGGNKIYSYSAGLSKWVDKGQCYSISQQPRPISRNYSTQYNPDSAISGSIEVHAWYDGVIGQIVISVFDNSTGTFHITDKRMGSTSVGNVKVIAIGGNFYVLYPKAGNILVYRKISAATPATVAAEVTLVSDCASALPSYDIVSDSTNMWLAYNNGTGINVKKLDSSASILATATIAEIPTNALSIVVSTNVFVYWHNGTNGTRYAVRDSSLSSVLAATTIEATTTPYTFAITAYPLSSTSQVVFYSVNASNTYNYLTKTATVSSSAVTSAASVLVRSISVVAKAFQVGSFQYFIGNYQSNLQSTNFCFRSDGLIVAKMLPTTAGGARNVGPNGSTAIAQVNQISSSVFSFSASEITKIQPYTLIGSDVDFTRLGTDAIKLDFAPSNSFQISNLGANLHIAGAAPSIYDGNSVVEQGFHVFPENVSASTGVTGGAPGMADGIYQYSIVYEWIDAKGQIHRSAPSVPTTVTISGGAGKGQATLTIPTLRITQKTSPRQEVGIQVYRTQANGSVFFNINAIGLIPPTANDPTADAVTIIDHQDNTTLGGSELLYTNGGVLENIAAPGHSLIDVYQSRALISGVDDPLQFWLSKTWQPLEGVAFNDSITLRCDPFGGDIKAVKFMDDKAILFKERAIFYVSGEGPNDSGQGSTYGTPQLISSDVGCPFPKSVVLTPNGVMFMSYKGIYLLDRSLTVSYIGAKVEAYNSQNFTAATLHNSKNQVRFLTDSGSTLAYDYLFQKWSTFTNHAGVSAAIADSGKYHYLRTDGTVYEESTSFQDAGTNQYLKPVTAWLKLNGLQAFQRVRSFAILAAYKSAHVLTVKVYYDYDDVNFDTYTFDAGANIASTSVPYEFRSPHLKRQKCVAIKFEIQDGGAGSVAEAYSITDITLDVGLKGGTNRLKASQTV